MIKLFSQISFRGIPQKESDKNTEKVKTTTTPNTLERTPSTDTFVPSVETASVAKAKKADALTQAQSKENFFL